MVRKIGHPTWIGYGPDENASAELSTPDGVTGAVEGAPPAKPTKVESVGAEVTPAPDDPPSSPSIVPPPPSAQTKRKQPKAPLVEISVVHEHGAAPHPAASPWPSVEIWTRNRVYLLDSQMNCVEVRDRTSSKTVPNHPFLGAILVGGQKSDGDTIELSHPFPRPGTEAVFERRRNRRSHFSRTSTVARVVLRLHIVTVAPNHVVPTWSEISALHDEDEDDESE